MVLGAIGLISTAIGGTIGLVKGLSYGHERGKQSISNKHTEEMQLLKNKHLQEMEQLSYEHDQAMQRLQNEASGEDHRHKEVMRLLGILDRALKSAGEFITGAKCEGCIGLPGN